MTFKPFLAFGLPFVVITSLLMLLNDYLFQLSVIAYNLLVFVSLCLAFTCFFIFIWQRHGAYKILGVILSFITFTLIALTLDLHEPTERHGYEALFIFNLLFIGVADMFAFVFSNPSKEVDKNNATQELKFGRPPRDEL